MIALRLHLAQMHDIDRARGMIAGPGLIGQERRLLRLPSRSVKRLK